MEASVIKQGKSLVLQTRQCFKCLKVMTVPSRGWTAPSLTALHKAVKNKSFGSSLQPPTYPKTSPNHNVITYLAINHTISMQVWSNLPHIIWVTLRECDLTEVNSTFLLVQAQTPFPIHISFILSAHFCNLWALQSFPSSSQNSWHHLAFPT